DDYWSHRSLHLQNSARVNNLGKDVFGQLRRSEQIDIPPFGEGIQKLSGSRVGVFAMMTRVTGEFVHQGIRHHAEMARSAEAFIGSKLIEGVEGQKLNARTFIDALFANPG